MCLKYSGPKIYVEVKFEKLCEFELMAFEKNLIQYSRFSVSANLEWQQSILDIGSAMTVHKTRK